MAEGEAQQSAQLIEELPEEPEAPEAPAEDGGTAASDRADDAAE